MSIYAIYFSPTGGTEKIVTFIAEQFGVYQSIDLCEKTSDLTNDFSEEDLCIIGVPSFGGRVPAIALERIKALSGNNATAILITVYGNRAYEDTLIELEDTLIEKNFTCQAAIAAIAEHSISRIIKIIITPSGSYCGYRRTFHHASVCNWKT